MAAASRGDEVRPLRPDDAAALERLWPILHPDPSCCAGSRGPVEALGSDGSLGLERGGELVAAAAVREWGRVAQVHGLAVAVEHRGQGLGRRLVDALSDGLRRADLAVVGVELPAEDPALAALLGAAGFRPQPPTWVLERAVRATASRHAPAVAPGEPEDRLDGDAPPGHDAPARAEAPRGADGGSGDDAGAGLALPAGLRLLGRAPGEEDLSAIGALASSLSADLDPVPWLSGLLAVGAAEALWTEEGGRALAVIPTTSGEAVWAGMVLVDESAPFLGLARLVEGLDELVAARGLTRLVLPGPTRCWDAVNALLALGFRPVASRPRFTLRGHPDRSDLRRVALTSWR